MKPVAVAVAMVIIASLILLTQLRNDAWHDELSLWDASVKMDPGNATALYYRGIALGKEGDLSAAIIDFTRAIDLDFQPTFVFMVYAARGVAFAKQGKYDLALADLNRSLDQDPGYDDGLINRGMVFNQLGMFDRAIADFTDAIEENLDPGRRMTAYFNRGIAFEKRGRREAAKQDYRQACMLGSEEGCTAEQALSGP